MPYFDLSINNKRIVIAGDSDLDLLIFSIITVLPSGIPILQLNGMRSLTNNNVEHLEWQNMEIAYGDVIRVSFLESLKGLNAMPPQKKRLGQKMTIDEIRAKRGLSNGLESEAVLNEEKHENKKIEWIIYDIVFDDLRRFSARSSGDATLHVSGTWHKTIRECKIELGNLMYDKGESWMEAFLSSGHWIDIKVQGQNIGR